MQLIALVDSADHVCCRYRLAANRPYFEQAGHQLELIPFPRSWWRWLQLSQPLTHADAVIVQRRLLPAWQLRLIRHSARRILYDIDDAVWLRDSYDPRGQHSSRRLRRFQGLVQAADAVLAGNAFLADAAARMAGAKRVEIVPTCVDPQAYFVARHTAAGTGVQLVWIGSASTLQGLASVRSLLEEIGQVFPGLSLKLVCDRFLSLENLTVVNRPWDEVHEATELACSDIGISWLPADEWSRGKCGLKVLQYMAAGLPVVANPVGVQAELVRHGQTGFLARTPAEWISAIGQLANDPERRRRFGLAGRQRVINEFSLGTVAAAWRHVLEGPQPRRKAA